MRRPPQPPQGSLRSSHSILLLCLMRARGSLASLHGCRAGRCMMRSGRARCLNLPVTFGALLLSGSGLSTRSPRPSSPRERRGLRRQAKTVTPFFMPLQRACPRGTRSCLTASLRASATQARAMPSIRHLHAPGPQRGPFRAADQQQVRRFVECHSGPLVTASADPACTSASPDWEVQPAKVNHSYTTRWGTIGELDRPGLLVQNRQQRCDI